MKSRGATAPRRRRAARSSLRCDGSGCGRRSTRAGYSRGYRAPRPSLNAPSTSRSRAFPTKLRRNYQANRLPRLPATVKPLVQDMAASFERTVRPVRVSEPTVVRTDARHRCAVAGPGPKNEGRWTRGCAAARRLGGYSYGQIRQAYGIDRVGAGAGGSVAILNDEESIVPSDGLATSSLLRLPGRPCTDVVHRRSDEPVQPRHTGADRGPLACPRHRPAVAGGAADRRVGRPEDCGSWVPPS